MAVLTSPNGAQADVPDELVERFLEQGWTKTQAKAPAKKAASKSDGK